MDYGKILSRTWQLIWKYKILWLFGILASCGNNANSGSSGANGSGFNYRFDANRPPDTLPPEMYHFFRNFSEFFERMSYQWGMWVGILILVVLVLAFVTFVIRVYGQVGLVRGALNADTNQPERLSFSEIAAEVKPFFWRLFGFQLLIFFVSFILVSLIVLVVIGGTAMTFGIGLLCFLPLICILVPVGWAVSIIIKQAVIAMLVDDLDIGNSLSRGWEVVRSRAVDYLVMGLILYIGGWIVTIVISLPQLFALAPLFSAILQGAWTDDWQNILNGVWISLACLVAYWPVLLVLRGIVNTFTESAWVLTYLEASRGESEPGELDQLEPEVEST